MKRNNNNELNVDFIGGSESLTKEEEQLISAFLKSSKRQTKQRIKNSEKPRAKRVVAQGRQKV